MIKSPPIGFTEPNFCAVLQGIKTETRRLSSSDKPKYHVGDICYLTEPTRIDTIFAHVAEVDHRWFKPEKVSHKISEDDLIKIKSRKSGMYKETIARFMLKSFARYRIEILDVKQEKLFDISEESAIAEGIKTRILDGVTTYWDYLENRFAFTCPKRSYISEIEMLHGKEVAQSNLLLWVYKFEAVSP